MTTDRPCIATLPCLGSQSQVRFFLRGMLPCCCCYTIVVVISSVHVNFKKVPQELVIGKNLRTYSLNYMVVS